MPKGSSRFWYSGWIKPTSALCWRACRRAPAGAWNTRTTTRARREDKHAGAGGVDIGGGGRGATVIATAGAGGGAARVRDGRGERPAAVADGAARLCGPADGRGNGGTDARYSDQRAGGLEAVRADGESGAGRYHRSEEHTSELQSLRHLVCR